MFLMRQPRCFEGFGARAVDLSILPVDWSTGKMKRSIASVKIIEKYFLEICLLLGCRPLRWAYARNAQRACLISKDNKACTEQQRRATRKVATLHRLHSFMQGQAVFGQA